MTLITRQQFIAAEVACEHTPHIPGPHDAALIERGQRAARAVMALEVGATQMPTRVSAKGRPVFNVQSGCGLP